MYSFDTVVNLNAVYEQTKHTWKSRKIEERGQCLSEDDVVLGYFRILYMHAKLGREFVQHLHTAFLTHVYCILM